MRIVQSFAPCLVLALAAAGCGKSKVDQCNAFIERANKAQTVISKLNYDGEDPAKFEQEAAAIDAEAKAVGAVEIADEKLVAMRNEYGANLGRLAKVTRDIAATAKDAKVPAKAAAVEAQVKKFERDAEKIEKDESALVDKVNAYCSGEK